MLACKLPLFDQSALEGGMYRYLFNKIFFFLILTCYMCYSHLIFYKSIFDSGNGNYKILTDCKFLIPYRAISNCPVNLVAPCTLISLDNRQNGPICIALKLLNRFSLKLRRRLYMTVGLSSPMSSEKLYIYFRWQLLTKYI